MQRALIALLIAASVLLLSNSSLLAAQAPDGTVKITSRSVSPGIGLSWGDGVLIYKGQNYPALQCIWPDKSNRFPWEPDFNPNWLWAQPLLFHEQPANARADILLKSMEE